MNVVATLAELFDLEQIQDDVFVGRNGHRRGVRDSVFGGQLISQALRAASLTVGAGVVPHALHAMFLRPAKRSEPVAYRVERVRDGRSLSVREIRAEQEGSLVGLAWASFKAPEPGARLDLLPHDSAPDPDACPSIDWDHLLETRVVKSYSLSPRVHMCDVFWVRAAHPVPADPTLRACALAYVSDLGSGFATLEVPGLPSGGPSLDHAMWFHEPVAVDDWLLVDNRPQRASDARGTYVGTIRDRAGVLAAALAQEVLLRTPGPYDRPAP